MLYSKLAFGALLALLAVLAAPAPSAQAYTAFVTNEKDNSVSVIDTNTWKVTKTFKVGQRRAALSCRRMASG